MKVGLIAPLVSPVATGEYIAEFGHVAEECGFHAIWLAEHVVLFDEYASRYPYAEDGRVPTGGENGFLETFTALTYLAATTKTLRLGSGICIVPQRNPVYTAKEAAAVDWLSSGRFDFGIGVGWQAEEFQAVEQPFERRGARCRSYMEVIRRLWCDEVSEYEDEFYELPACRMYPKPVQMPHPPIYVGGESRAALQRVADFGQGWYALKQGPEDLPQLLARLDEMLAARDRRRADVQIAVSPYFGGCDAEKLRRYHDAGVDQVILPAVASSRAEIRSVLEPLAEELIAEAASL